MRCFAIAVFAVPALAGAQGFGPLEVRNLRSLSLPFLRLDPRRPVLATGEKTITLDFTAANELNYLGNGEIREDYEMDRLLVRTRRGIGRGWDVTVDASLLSRGGGFLDPIVKAWHDHVLAGLNPYRTDAPFGRNYIVLPDARFGAATGIGDISFAATKRLGAHSMVTVAAKLPTGNAGQAVGSGGADVATAFQTQVPLMRKLDLHLQAGVVVQSPSSSLSHARGLVHQAAFALTYRANSRDQWVMQLQSEDSATVTGVTASDTGHRIFSAGFQRRIDSRSWLELVFCENQDWPNWPIPRLANQGPDFTAGIKLTRKF